jgi:hypothetical protein
MFGEFSVKRQQFAFRIMQCAFQVIVTPEIGQRGGRPDDPAVRPGQWRCIDDNGDAFAVPVREAAFVGYHAFPLQSAA